MRRTGLTDLAAFLSIAEHRSFRRAAAALDVSPSAISHALRGLEERVGVRLLNRTTRSLALTAEGERLVAGVGPAMRSIDETIAELGESAKALHGRIRINAMQRGAVVLAGFAAEFLRQHPGVEIEISSETAFVDIVEKGFDA